MRQAQSQGLCEVLRPHVLRRQGQGPAGVPQEQQGHRRLHRLLRLLLPHQLRENDRTGGPASLQVKGLLGEAVQRRQDVHRKLGREDPERGGPEVEDLHRVPRPDPAQPPAPCRQRAHRGDGKKAQLHERRIGAGRAGEDRADTDRRRRLPSRPCNHGEAEGHPVGLRPRRRRHQGPVQGPVEDPGGDRQQECERRRPGKRCP